MRYDVNEVFTPRSHDVNEKMYIQRPIEEKKLLRAINGSLHAILFGESGNGKSWLYKKVFMDNNINYAIANAANAARYNSITTEIYNCIIDTDKYYKGNFTQSTEVGVNAVIVGKSDISQEYILVQAEKLEQSFQHLSEKSKHKNISVIVIDNLEMILKNQSLLDELSNILILLDDPRYAKFKIKILLVGLPTVIIEYFRKSKNTESVGNRINELDKLLSLSEEGVREFINKGFNGELKLNILDLDINYLTNHIYNITLGIAQRVQEYCELLAYQIEDNQYHFSRKLLASTDLDWMKKGLRQSYSIIENYLNSKDTKVGRRNQVLYAIGLLKTYDFTPNFIEHQIKQEFPLSVQKNQNLNISNILNVLAIGDSPILRRKESSNIYEVIDPRYIMVIRIVLFNDRQSGKVIKKKFLI